MRIKPSLFVLYARLEHRSVCFSTLRMTPWEIIFSSSRFSLSFMWILHLRGASMNDPASSSKRSFASLEKFPIVSNCCSVVTVMRYPASATPSTLKVTSSNCSLVGRPTTAGPGTSTT